MASMELNTSNSREVILFLIGDMAKGIADLSVRESDGDDYSEGFLSGQYISLSNVQASLTSMLRLIDDDETAQSPQDQATNESIIESIQRIFGDRVVELNLDDIPDIHDIGGPCGAGCMCHTNADDIGTLDDALADIIAAAGAENEGMVNLDDIVLDCDGNVVGDDDDLGREVIDDPELLYRFTYTRDNSPFVHVFFATNVEEITNHVRGQFNNGATNLNLCLSILCWDNGTPYVDDIRIADFDLLSFVVGGVDGTISEAISRHWTQANVVGWPDVIREDVFS